MRWLVVTWLLVLGPLALGQSVDDWLEQYKLATKNGDAESRNAALRAMLDYRDPRINRVYLDALFDAPVENQAKWCLIRVGGSAFPEGWRKIESDPSKFALKVLRVWAECGPGGVREMVKGFEHASEAVLRETARLFASNSFNNAQAMSLPLFDVQRGLRRALDAQDAATRRFGLRSITYLNQGDRDAALLKAVKDTDAGVRVQALSLIYLCSQGRKSIAIVEATSDADGKVRAEAVRALSFEFWNSLDNPTERAGVVIDRLQDKDPTVRQVAIGALSRWVDPRGWFGYETKPPSAEQAEVIESVRKLLRERKVADTAYLLLRDAVSSDVALRYLAYVADQRVFQRLIAGCESKDYEVSYNSVVLLGLFGDPKALPVLRRMVERSVHRSDAERSIKQIEARGVTSLRTQSSAVDTKLKSRPEA